jgi:hypothetical protein
VARSPAFIRAGVVARAPRAQTGWTAARSLARRTSTRNVVLRTLAAQKIRGIPCSCASLRHQLQPLQVPALLNLARAFWSRLAGLITGDGCARGANITIRGKPVISYSRARICTGLKATTYRCVLRRTVMRVVFLTHLTFTGNKDQRICQHCRLSYYRR